jgi:DNA-binding response OmpR family regulator
MRNRSGWHPTTAATGAEAWQQLCARSGHFDVVLLDRMMPDMDGIQVLRQMKANGDLVHTPVIMQTSVTGDAAVAEGLKAGAYYYLTMPSAADTLLAIGAAAARDRLEYLQLQQEVGQASRTLTCLTRAAFAFSTTDEARDIATTLANVAPDPGRAVLGLSELEKDPRFATNPDRVKNRQQLLPILEGRFRERTMAEWQEKFQGADVPCGPVNDLAMAMQDPQVVHNRMAIDMESPTHGAFRTMRHPIRFLGTPARYELPPPALGQHTREVLAALGLASEAIDRLAAGRVV